jgi:argininosuccinate lyase
VTRPPDGKKIAENKSATHENTTPENKDERMWGGRFDRQPDRGFYEFQRSFRFDRRLLPYELRASRAWARALGRAGLLNADETNQIISALDAVERMTKDDPSRVAASPAEDVHHFVESELIERLGPLGAKLHTGRSRNEQVVTGLRLFLRDAAAETRRALAQLLRALAGQAESNFGVPMPGMTHMQYAQPLLFSHFLLAHAEGFLRDAARLSVAAQASEECPLGSGALSGTAFPLNREAVAHELGFASVTGNSLDAVGQRDFVAEYLFTLAMIATHLSRLAEDYVLFASTAYGWVILPDEFSTGSSLMPQKKNPDVWELIRGKTGRVTAALFSLLTALKGLPSSYQRDLQEDKEPLFAAHDETLGMLGVAAGAVAATRVNGERLRRACEDPGLLATEAADFLVKRGMPFRAAHEIVGKICLEAEQSGKLWTELPLETLRRFSPLFDESLAMALTVEAALARRDVPGGTAPGRVRAALAECRKQIEKLESALDS